MNEREIAMVCAQLGRRQVLKAFAGAVGGVALTACGGGGGGAVSASMPSLAGVRTDSVLTTGGGASRNLTTTQNPPPDEPVERVSTNTENKLQISLPSGSQTNYPLQFGRAFPRGTISGAPSVALDGVTLTLQQADVKTRYDDGSVKFAVISVVIPSLGTTERMLSITNKAAGTEPAAETRANMLANYDFEATIGVAVGGTQVAGAPVSARAMLAALSDSALAAETVAGGVNSRYWTVGPVCTTVLLCDHTTKAWDIGTNATKAIRPMFHVQFWPGIGKYHVRHILEVADVTKLKDEIGLSVTFTTGQAAPVTRLTQSGVYIYAATFQSRSYWGGTQVPRANIKHGVAYMASTMAMPNYDSSIVMNEPAIANYATDWAGRSKLLNAAGYWQKAMASTGGRQDLGLMPKWDAVALYSGAAHMHEICEVQAELAGSWAFYFREGNAAKVIFDSAPGRGRIISKVSRPMQMMYDNNNYIMSTAGADSFVVDGVISQSRDGWTHDSAHTPGTFWFQYLTTGAAFWHEKLIQLGAWSQFLSNPAKVYNSIGTGLNSSDMVLNGVQARGWGWQMRNRARAWWASLDDSPERSLFDKSLIDALAQRAGLYDVAGMMVGNPVRDAWNANYAVYYTSKNTVGRPNALNYWEPKGGYTEAQFIASMGSAPDDWGIGAQAPWMRSFIIMCIYHAVELGVSQAKPLADWAALQTMAVANSTEPLHLGDYVFPDVKTGNGYYQTLEDIYDGWAHVGSMSPSGATGFPAGGAPNTLGVTVESSSTLAAAAIALAQGAPGQVSAWAFVRPYHQNTVFYNHDPRYAIVPRN